MKKTIKALITVSALVAASLCAPAAAKAAGDECLEIGWIDQAGKWTYYRAWLTGVDENELHLKYDYNHGKMDLRVIQREASDGENVLVFKGDWREGGGRAGGFVRMILEKGRHHARGFYTNGTNPQKFDLKLGECTHIAH